MAESEYVGMTHPFKESQIANGVVVDLIHPGTAVERSPSVG